MLILACCPLSLSVAFYELSAFLCISPVSFMPFIFFFFFFLKQKKRRRDCFPTNYVEIKCKFLYTDVLEVRRCRQMQVSQCHRTLVHHRLLQAPGHLPQGLSAFLPFRSVCWHRLQQHTLQLFADGYRASLLQRERIAEMRTYHSHTSFLFYVFSSSTCTWHAEVV